MLRTAGGAIIRGNEHTGAAHEAAHADLDAMERLELLVRTLVERYGTLSQECQALRGDADAQSAVVAQRDARIAELEAELRVSNQQRVDVGKRIDDLLGQFDQLEQALTPDDADGDTGASS